MFDIADDDLWNTLTLYWKYMYVYMFRKACPKAWIMHCGR